MYYVFSGKTSYMDYLLSQFTWKMYILLVPSKIDCFTFGLPPN